LNTDPKKTGDSLTRYPINGPIFENDSLFGVDWRNIFNLYSICWNWGFWFGQ